MHLFYTFLLKCRQKASGHFRTFLSKRRMSKVQISIKNTCSELESENYKSFHRDVVYLLVATSGDKKVLSISGILFGMLYRKIRPDADMF